MSRPLTARLTSRLQPVADKLANQPVVLTNLAGTVIGAVALVAPIDADLKAALIGSVVGVVTLFSKSQVVPVNKLVSGAVAQSAPGEPVSITSPEGTTTTVGG